MFTPPKYSYCMLTTINLNKMTGIYLCEKIQRIRLLQRQCHISICVRVHGSSVLIFSMLYLKLHSGRNVVSQGKYQIAYILVIAVCSGV